MDPVVLFVSIVAKNLSIANDDWNSFISFLKYQINTSYKIVRFKAKFLAQKKTIRVLSEGSE
jgi:hypothetical protein